MAESIKKKDWLVMYLESLSNNMAKLYEYYANGEITKEAAYEYLISALIFEHVKLRILARRDPELKEILPKKPSCAVAKAPSPSKENGEGNKNPYL